MHFALWRLIVIESKRGKRRKHKHKTKTQRHTHKDTQRCSWWHNNNNRFTFDDETKPNKVCVSECVYVCVCIGESLFGNAVDWIGACVSVCVCAWCACVWVKQNKAITWTGHKHRIENNNKRQPYATESELWLKSLVPRVCSCGLTVWEVRRRKQKFVCSSQKFEAKNYYFVIFFVIILFVERIALFSLVDAKSDRKHEKEIGKPVNWCWIVLQCPKRRFENDPQTNTILLSINVTHRSKSSSFVCDAVFEWVQWLMLRAK